MRCLRCFARTSHQKGLLLSQKGTWRPTSGIWYVTSSVKWQSPAQVEGGSMMQRVDVRGGRFVKVMLP